MNQFFLINVINIVNKFKTDLDKYREKGYVPDFLTLIYEVFNMTK